MSFKPCRNSFKADIQGNLPLTISDLAWKTVDWSLWKPEQIYCHHECRPCSCNVSANTPGVCLSALESTFGHQLPFLIAGTIYPPITRQQYCCRGGQIRYRAYDCYHLAGSDREREHKEKSLNSCNI